LATVYGIVKQNNGFIKVTSEPDKGTTFEICLPRHVAAKAEPAQSEPLTAPVARGFETILLVEDEPAILRMTKTMLEQLGYTVLTASTPGEAIQLAGAYTGVIHLLMTDVVMPEMNGRDLAKNLLTSSPALKRLFMSGYTADVIAHHGVLDEGVHFIQKPFSKKDLAAGVSKALERR
jgi:CheY-like chemotaxis protein